MASQRVAAPSPTTGPAMAVETERLDAWTDEGRRVAVWRSTLGKPRQEAPLVVLSPGFARKMRDVSSIALCLVRNGAVVYRFDSLDHIGLSDGTPDDYTLGAVEESFRATMELARSRENCRRVILVALSMSNLPAYRLAAEDSGIDRVLAISGVVNGIRTLEGALGRDYTLLEYDELPDRVDALGIEIDPRPLWLEHRATGCLSLEQTVTQLAKIKALVANCVAINDPWVDADECHSAFSEGAGGERLVVRIPYSGHDLGRNPVAVTTILQNMTQLAMGVASSQEDEQVDVIMPKFDELLEVRIAERHRERRERMGETAERELSG